MLAAGAGTAGTAASWAKTSRGGKTNKAVWAIASVVIAFGRQCRKLAGTSLRRGSARGRGRERGKLCGERAAEDESECDSSAVAARSSAVAGRSRAVCGTGGGSNNAASDRVKPAAGRRNGAAQCAKEHSCLARRTRAGASTDSGSDTESRYVTQETGTVVAGRPVALPE
jgi:hypothetical protein